MTLTMQGGVKIPIIGLGTWQATNEEELEKSLNAALEIGYRHIDTAAIYGNEHVIGRVLKQWFTSGKLKREDIFITTKLAYNKIHPDLVEGALKESLEKLQLDYVDLYLVHCSIYMIGSIGQPLDVQPTDLLGVWKKMEEQVDAKRATTIGISNWGLEQIDRLLKNCRIKPANTQVELHIYLQQKNFVEFCQKNNIVVVSYSTLGSPGSKSFFSKVNMTLPNILEDPVVTNVGKKHGKSTAQVVLRFFTQKDIVVIPKSINPQRLQANFNILDFTLDSQDIKELESLDKGETGRIFGMEFFNPKILEHPEYPFKQRL